MQRRTVSLWFPRLASDRALRQHPLECAQSTAEPPFALTLRESNTERLYCLSGQAQHLGLMQGMTLSDARALRPDLITRPATPELDQQFLRALARWAGRYCPWVGVEGRDGLVLDVSGSTHLFGGESEMLADMRMRLTRAGIAARIGLADSRGAAWALAHFDEGVAAPGDPLPTLRPLPVAALRLDGPTCVALERLGLRTVGDLHDTPRAPLSRRFGNGVLMRLDQALGVQGEPLTPLPDPPRYGVRLTLPEPIGLSADVMAGLARLLEGLCGRLRAQDMGARVLQLTLRRVDQASQQVELRLARAMNDPAVILPLFERGVDAVEAGYGIDQLRLGAPRIEALPPAQIQSAIRQSEEEGVASLITKLGTRIGLENVQRFLPADSHIPERAHILAAAAFSEPVEKWPRPTALPPRPLRLFAPEPIGGQAVGPGREPPRQFRWRGMRLERGHVEGPERLTPEWWLPSEDWQSGVRDYWRVETRQGRRLWLYHTPQNPGWFVQGEFA
ncbi:Y-family DNA polymerase [Thalassobius sp. MITS945101]|uniref:Y-family DNA polymerase n=1 Tax=Thalassobius sp. MITS945101 TaxID=3096994 RepID=UPI00399A5849